MNKNDVDNRIMHYCHYYMYPQNDLGSQVRDYINEDKIEIDINFKSDYKYKILFDSINIS